MILLLFMTYIYISLHIDMGIFEICLLSGGASIDPSTTNLTALNISVAP